jgi:hypothetical protein
MIPSKLYSKKYPTSKFLEIDELPRRTVPQYQNNGGQDARNLVMICTCANRET